MKTLPTGLSKPLPNVLAAQQHQGGKPTVKTLAETQSICPECGAVLPAVYVQRENAVYFEKTCPEHGAFSVLAASDAARFAAFVVQPVNVPPKRPLTESRQGCPYDCGPCENHLQTACCVLLEVTQRCNQRCTFCYASSGGAAPPDPPLAAVLDWLRFLKAEGEARPFNIQLSGGEPTVRDDLPDIVRAAVGMGFPYIQLNTNGRRLAAQPGYAQTLKDAGVSAVFLQFDSLRDDACQALRGEALLAEKRGAIEACRAARLPVALVPTVVAGVNDGEVGALVRFAIENIDVVKGVHFQPVSYMGRHPGAQSRVNMFDLADALEAQTDGLVKAAELAPIVTGHGLCCFTGAYTLQDDGTLASVRQAGVPASCCEVDFGAGCDEEDAGCCGSEPPPCCEGAGADCCTGETSGCCDTGEMANCCNDLNALTVVEKDRDFVKNRWMVSGQTDAGCCGNSLDAFLDDFRKRSLTLTAMHFQDAWTVDLERVRRCRVQVFDDYKLIPFCTYNLTDAAGRPIYRGVQPKKQPASATR